MSEAQKKVGFLEHRARFGKDGSRRSEDAYVYAVDGQLVTVLVAFLAVTTLDGSKLTEERSFLLARL